MNLFTNSYSVLLKRAIGTIPLANTLSTSFSTTMRRAIQYIVLTVGRPRLESEFVYWQRMHGEPILYMQDIHVRTHKDWMAECLLSMGHKCISIIVFTFSPRLCTYIHSGCHWRKKSTSLVYMVGKSSPKGIWFPSAVQNRDKTSLSSRFDGNQGYLRLEGPPPTRLIYALCVVKEDTRDTYE